MKKWSMALAALAAALLAPMIAPVQAQDTVPVMKPFRVKVGGLFFTDGDVKDAVGKNAFYVGLGYDITKTAVDKPTLVEIYLDYANKDRDNFEISVLGVGAAAKYLIQSPNLQWQPYVGAGVGVYWVEGRSESVADTPPVFTAASRQATVTTKEDKTGVGGKVFAGIQSNMGIFGELDYTITPSIDGDRADGWGLRLGYRF